jgi:acetyltransferase-like isoleucine patch superfamily enzyme
MLAAVLSLFMIFSFTGVASLNLASYTSMEAQNSVQAVKNQYAVESTISVALWRMNAIADSAANFTSGDVTCSYDAPQRLLTASIDRYDKRETVRITLADDNHFTHSLSARSGIEYNGYALNSISEPREFDFLPQSDLNYYYSNAVEIHTESNHTYHNGQLADGIHVFLGSNIELENVSIFGSAVFVGENITFDKNVHIVADTTLGDAAMIFTNPNVETSFIYNHSNNSFTVNGPIYSEGTIYLRDGDLSGPIVADRIELLDDITLNEEIDSKFYKWTHGFGEQDDYEFPKRVNRWERTAS